MPIPHRLSAWVWFHDGTNKTGTNGRRKNRDNVGWNHCGETYLDDWLDVYIKGRAKKAFSVLDWMGQMNIHDVTGTYI